MSGRTFCPLGDGAAGVVVGMIKHFRSEFEEHIKKKSDVLLVNNNNKKIKVHLSIKGQQKSSKISKKTGSLLNKQLQVGHYLGGESFPW